MKQTKEFNHFVTVGMLSTPATQKFAGIIYQNPPNFSNVKDDVKMDLYYSQMGDEYTLCAHTYVKDMQKTFSKLMKAYYFLSKHPKIEVKFPRDGSKPPPKNPSSIKKNKI